MRRILFALAALCVLGLGGWAVSAYSEVRSGAAPKPQAAASVPVTATVAETRDMSVTVTGIGSVQAYNNVAIKTRVDGQIVKVDFTEGQDVKAGDVLFEIDPRPFQAALAQAQANRQKDTAMLASASADLQRFADLAKNGYQTRQSLDQQKAQVGQLQASIAADDAQIQAASINLDYTKIQAPIGGRTGARQVDIGNIVHATDTGSLVTITQLQPIFVSFTLPQQDLDALRQSGSNGAVPVQVMSQSSEHLLADGTLSLIDNQVDQGTGTIHLKAQFANADHALWPGAFVTVNVVTGVRQNAVIVPAETVQQGPNGPYLYVIRPDNSVEQRAVSLSQSNGTLAVIATGLAAGERVVLTGQYGLSAGSKVVVQAAPRAASPPA
jgi:multidrug efflux system membrane fusion protein